MHTEHGEYIGTAYLQEQPPHNEVLGPVQPRGPTAGMVLRHENVVAQWGDVTRPDMTFSVAKSFLAILAGLAVSDGLIQDVDEPVVSNTRCASGMADHFASAHNSKITWRHLLQQTSEWSGTLWDKPDTVDSNRQTDAGANVDNALKGTFRERREPGTYWEYNDVRVNLLALALLHIFRRPLDLVLEERVMRPVGASQTWKWLSYANAHAVIDGQRLSSVPGGGHWGGGLVMSASDLARFGHLILRDGNSNGPQLIDAAWIEELSKPCPLNTNYGYMWWLNTNGKQCRDAPPSSIYAAGAGSNIVWIDKQNNLVIVCRWTAKEKVGDLVSLIMRSIQH